MAKVEMCKVFFGARFESYTGADTINIVGREGILVLYTYVDAPDECILCFYSDDVFTVKKAHHSRSRFHIENGMLFAKSFSSGAEKAYRIGGAIEMGPEVFECDEYGLDICKAPDGWRALFLKIHAGHAWFGSPVHDLPNQANA